jgi:hypothetical protein
LLACLIRKDFYMHVMYVVVLGYERKGFIRLKECFRVSKTEDHYQQFDS